MKSISSDGICNEAGCRRIEAKEMHHSFRVEPERAVDPQLIGNIMSKIKSQGIFDKLRQNCLENIEANEHYQALKRRTDDYAKEYLNRKRWDPRMGKKEIRDSLRAEVLRQRFLVRGIESILDEIVNEDRIQEEFCPEVQRVTFEHLGIDLPEEDSKEAGEEMETLDGIGSGQEYEGGKEDEGDQIIVDEGAELQINFSEHGDVIREESMDIESDESASQTQESQKESLDQEQEEVQLDFSANEERSGHLSPDLSYNNLDSSVLSTDPQEGSADSSCEVVENDTGSLNLMQFVAEEEEDSFAKAPSGDETNIELDLNLQDDPNNDPDSADDNRTRKEADKYEDMLAEISLTNLPDELLNIDCSKSSRSFDPRSPGSTSESESAYAGGRLKAIKRRYEMVGLGDESSAAKQPHIRSDESDSGASSSGSKPSSRMIAGKLPLKKRCSALQTVEEENWTSKVTSDESESAHSSRKITSGASSAHDEHNLSRPSSSERSPHQESSRNERQRSSESRRSSREKSRSRRESSGSQGSDSSPSSRSSNSRGSSSKSSSASGTSKHRQKSKTHGSDHSKKTVDCRKHDSSQARSPAKRRSKRSSQKHKNCPCCC